ncbi:MAG: hypothetical protein AAF664_03605 [Planctomycetota bacterium]
MKLLRTWHRRSIKALQAQVAHQSLQIAQLQESLERSMTLSAKILDRLPNEKPTLRSSGYQVTSQFDDDGILAYLASFIPPDRRQFVEFGVEDYTEANTRLLLKKDHWKGLVLDGSEQHIDRIKQSDLAWKYGLDAVHAFITAENINSLIAGAIGEPGQRASQPVSKGVPIGLLSIDIDGNDYWVWKAIECFDASVVVCEYNAIFGSEAAVTIPYDPSFERHKAHYSNLYFGCSLAALVDLASEKGLRFIGCNLAGNNAYFVNQSFQIPVPTLTSREGFVASQFREGRDQSGELLLKPLNNWLPELSMLPLVDLRTNTEIRVGDLSEVRSLERAA